jgi:RNA-directed DNA polymerase
MLFVMDSELTSCAGRQNVQYTRYADDITVSGDSIDSVVAFENLIQRYIGKMKSPKLIFNKSKRGLYTKGERRLVTGLVLTPERRISIGRERKRTISVLLHKQSLGELSQEAIGTLKGLLGFTIANEPTFVDRMRVKYGDAVIDKALRARIPSRKERR